MAQASRLFLWFFGRQLRQRPLGYEHKGFTDHELHFNRLKGACVHTKIDVLHCASASIPGERLFCSHVWARCIAVVPCPALPLCGFPHLPSSSLNAAQAETLSTYLATANKLQHSLFQEFALYETRKSRDMNETHVSHT